MTATATKPTHCDRILSVLADGKPHSHLELYRLGTVAHSRISELRRRGHTIQQWKQGDLYLYRLLTATPVTSSPGVAVSEPAVDGAKEVAPVGVKGSLAGSLTITETVPRSTVVPDQERPPEELRVLSLAGPATPGLESATVSDKTGPEVAQAALGAASSTTGPEPPGIQSPEVRRFDSASCVAPSRTSARVAGGPDQPDRGSEQLRLDGYPASLLDAGMRASWIRRAATLRAYADRKARLFGPAFFNAEDGSHYQHACRLQLARANKARAIASDIERWIAAVSA